MKSIIILFITTITLLAMDLKPWNGKLEQLSDFEKHVIINKGTELPYTGKHLYNKKDGIYTCKVCDSPLYKSDDKFDSNCGWPSFDDEIEGAIKRVKDADGKRVEIVCNTCGAHLGHVFTGEGFTKKNIRHCVNSISLNFKEDVDAKTELKKAYFAGGCFWGVEYYLEKLDGVQEVTSGFMGGKLKNPSYKDVIYKNTGHLEVVEVLYNPNKITYEALAKMFFEIHNPEQVDGQGPDIGEQYLSAVFVSDTSERKTIQKLINILESKGYKVATTIREKKEFYKAEGYHQDYYEKKGSTPYCHGYVKRF